MATRLNETFKLNDFRGHASDFDGTISDSLGAHYSTETAALAHMAEEEGDERFTSIPESIVKEARRNGSNDLSIIGGALVMAGVVQDIEDERVLKTVLHKRKLYNALCKAGMDAQPFATRFLRTIHSRTPNTSFICTTAHLEEVSPFLRKHDLTNLFPRERLVVQEDVGQEHLKPHPLAYQIPLRRIGETDAASFAAYEDTPVGIRAARRAGMVVVAIATTHTEEELIAANPDFLFEDHRELLAKAK